MAVRIAATPQVRWQALQLVQEKYRNSGLLTKKHQRWPVRVVPQHMSAGTSILVAQDEGRVMATLTLVTDDECGLPMEVVFQPEIEVLRWQGLLLSEVSCFASYIEDTRELIALFSLTIHAARWQKVDRLVIAVHPHHAKFYTRMMGFETLAEERTYATVGDNPAVALSHDFAVCDEQPYPLYERIYHGQRFRQVDLLPQPMKTEERNRLANFLVTEPGLVAA